MGFPHTICLRTSFKINVYVKSSLPSVDDDLVAHCDFQNTSFHVGVWHNYTSPTTVLKLLLFLLFQKQSHKLSVLKLNIHPAVCLG